MARELTRRQQAWVDYYKAGHSAAEAARLAGYQAKSDKAFQNIGSENLGKLGAYIQEREDVLTEPRIADMREVNAFWTQVMRSEEEKTADRLKASELRAKAAGAFTDRLEIGNLDGKPLTCLDLSGMTDEELRQLASEPS